MPKIKLVFSVFGESFNPDYFSSLIELMPTEYWIKGEEILKRGNIKRKETSWNYSIGFVETYHLEEVTEAFLRDFPSKNRVKIKNYIYAHNLNVKVDFIIKIFKDEKPGISLGKEFLEFVSHLGGEIDIDLYLLPLAPG